MSNPKYSICHTSARPGAWRAVYDDWMGKAAAPGDVEYVLAIDPRWGFSLDPAAYDLPNLVVVQNTGRRCYVDGVNIAARASSGEILIVNADDQFACDAWDAEIWRKVKRFKGDDAGASWVLDVNVGTPSESVHKVCQMPILSRKRYEDQGSVVFFAGYESMCCDNDFREWAVQDGVLIDGYDLPLFPHIHPLYSADGKWQSPNPEKWDEAYRVQNRKEAYESGKAILNRRRAAKFGRRRSIAWAYPGDDFRGRMHDSLMRLYAHFIERDFEVLWIRASSPNIYIVRDDIRGTIANLSPKPDLILMQDHDNPLSPEQFDTLLNDLDSRPEVDGVAGWCYIFDEELKKFVPSCGLWAPNHLQWQPFPSSFAREIDLKPFECGGLPCILTRHSAYEKAGDDCFMPVVDKRLPHGVLGEDFCFFRGAETGGASFVVDPKIRVPHLKYVDVSPVFAEDGAPNPVKAVCMMRVKNEARWIGRTIASVKELCGENIFVMEDGSSDNTREVAEAAGAVVLDSPFVGMGLDESRDKNWLMQEVLARVPDADWILMPDGDEELEPEGCAKIKRVLETNPPCDSFALRFVYVWDSIDHMRIDGVYGNMARQSLFRANKTFEFRSYYSGEGENHNHVGLHTSNAPGLGGRVLPMNVVLFHYGYLWREDRIRKYRWILTVDPCNPVEGFYRHCVQGDLPEIPADEEVYGSNGVHLGGPLELRKLPPHLIPKWDVVPGPLDLEKVQVQVGA